VKTCVIERSELRSFGLASLGQIGNRHRRINTRKKWLELYQFLSKYPDDDYSWLTCVLALKSIDSGNFGIGSILVNHIGTVVSWGHNEVFKPYFRSDRHAEMVVLNRFEDSNRNNCNMKGYTLYTSLESCPMCLARLINSRINSIVHVAEDTMSGMTHKMEDLPATWITLADSQIFRKADCSEQLTQAAVEIFRMNADELNEVLRKR
jgi:cytosine deaminase